MPTPNLLNRLLNAHGWNAGLCKQAAEEIKKLRKKIQELEDAREKSS